jgi:dephospho-CoA kinase
MKHRIVAIVGMPGARKSDATALFVSQLGIPWFNMSTLIREELIKQNEVLTPTAYYTMGGHLRDEFGLNVLAVRTLARLPIASPFCIVDGVRMPAEVEYFRTQSTFFRVLGIHASQSLRFERMRSRSGVELQAIEDLKRQDDENLALGLGNVIALSDYMIVNSDYSPRPFELAVKEICALLVHESVSEHAVNEN